MLTYCDGPWCWLVFHRTTRTPAISHAQPKVVDLVSMGHAVNDRRFSTLTLTAQGIVYEDIGTSLLYAVRTWFHESHGIAFTIKDILGILSLTI
jgi:hypothetical protein